MTTTGRTTRCSANRVKAAGSASRTLVSRTYVRRCTELATQTPLGAGNEGRHRGQDTHRPGSSGDKRVGWTGAAPLERPRRPSRRTNRQQGASRGGRPGEPPATTEGTRVLPARKVLRDTYCATPYGGCCRLGAKPAVTFGI